MNRTSTASRHVSAQLLLCAGLALPDAVAGQAVGPAGLAGACYDLSLGAWRPPPRIGGDSIFIAPPSRVRFDSVRAERAPNRFTLTTPPGALPSVHRYAWWRPLGGGVVELLWSTGHSGLRMTLGGSRDELSGEARAFWDFPSEPLVATAVARRVSCDAPAPEASAQRFVFRAVPVTGGDSVALGMPLDAVRSRADSLHGRTFRLRGTPIAPFERASAVEFSVNRRDTVGRVEVLYPEDVELDSIAASLTRMLGEPVSRDTMRLRAIEATDVNVSWTNRTTRLTLYRSALTTGGWRTSAVLTDPRLRP